MNLLLPSEDLLDSNPVDLITKIQAHARQEGYAVVKRRSKKSKKGILMKIGLRCELGDKIQDNHGQQRIHSISKIKDCSFSAYIKLTGDQ